MPLKVNITTPKSRLSLTFVGPEKLLEVWFAPAPDALPLTAAKDGLMSVSPETWKEMLDIVCCKVLSTLESDHVNAYLLSESSMFVFRHKLILKTCGTTTLLWGLPRMLEIAASKAGFPHHKISTLKGDLTAMATPYRVFYSRKNFIFPDKQRGPHRSWKDEVHFLDNMFSGGSAYMVGKMNGDHWYLYLTSPNTSLTRPGTPESEKATETKLLQFPVNAVNSLRSNSDDETLEILMTDLDEKNSRQFYLEDATAIAEGKFFQRANQPRKDVHHNLGDLASTGVQNLSMSGTTAGSSSVQDETFDVFSNTSSDHTEGLTTPEEDSPFPEELSTEGHALGTVISEACGLSDVYPTSRYPDARVDAYMFTPCGFSANGIIPAPDQAGTATHYFTVHVAPEPENSYASFETNVPGRQTGRETGEIITHVVDIFKPGRFSVTLFEARAVDNDGSEQIDEVSALKRESGRSRNNMEKIKGYRRVERIVHEFDGYDLVFRYYERDGWEGGGVRVGEVL
jgi:S-adenosylmethionine decarboxylase